MNKNGALLAVAVFVIGMSESRAEPVTASVIAATAAATVIVNGAGKLVNDCRVIWKMTEIRVFGRKIGKTHSPQFFCNPPKI